MSDIDFDELDRAVNGALGTPSFTDSTGTTSTRDASVSEVPAEVPAIERIERTQLTPISKAPAATAPAARRGSGRFMDMVHPSSDMRSPNNTRPVESKVGAAPITPQPKAEEPTSETPAWNEPLESPFLPDAKVEKRPLGGVGSASEAASISEPFSFKGLLDDEPEEELLEAPEPQERIEATSTPDAIDLVAATAVPDEIESRTYEDAEPAIEDAPVESEPVPAPEQSQPVYDAPQAVAEEPVGPTSITHQYKEQPSSNQESGAIFDTEAYHQAVVPPVKKRSGLVTFIWIIILVLLGAAAGWAVYTYVLPMI